MGATLVGVLIHGGDAYTAEVGDSRAYLLRRSKLTRITKDQTQLQILLDMGLLTEDLAKQSHAKNIVLQACGRAPELVVAQNRIPLRARDRLLLCSDGLTLNVGDAEIENILSAAPIEDACAQLMALAIERGGQDNVTVLVVEVGGALPVPGPDDAAAVAENIRAFSPVEVNGDA
jgi:serine/threonine protein phosphatase PrpC